MANIKDVAKRAGVSTATVSHVINETRSVLPETRAAVLQAINDLNYRPSAVARGLTTNTTRTIGVIISDVSSPFFARLLRDVENLLFEMGYNLFVCNTYEEVDRESHNLELLLDKRVDGIIITPTGHDQPIYTEFNKLAIPLVYVDRKPPHSPGTLVGVDNFKASYEMTRHLIELGHRRIGLVSLIPETSAVSARLQGYQVALQENGIEIDPELMTVSDFEVDTADSAVRGLLGIDDRPSAIIAGSHVATLGTLQALRALDFEYPRDISLVCFDNSRWTPIVRPSLTVVTKPVAELARISVETMLNALSQIEAQRKRYETPQCPDFPDVLLEPITILRESCRSLSDQ